MGKLDGATVLVIGGGSGMGLGIAQAAASEGAIVVVAGSSPEKLVTAVQSIGGQARSELVDITDESSVGSLFDKIGEFNHLAITASPGSRSDFRTQSVAEAHGYMEGKFWGTYRAAWHAAQRINKAGSMIFLTGGYVVRPAPGSAVVTSAYGAVEGLTRALAIELAPIRINAIRPGMIDTPIWSYLSEADREKVYAEAARKAVVGRIGTPSDIGSAAVYLLTNGFITGTVLDVEGGAFLR